MNDQSAADVIAAGHICLDIIPDLSGTPAGDRALILPGQLTRIGPATLATGGPVSNVGLSLHKLGLGVALMGKVGDDVMGQSILEVIRRIQPDLADGMIVDPQADTSYTLVISPPGADRSFLHCPGANDTFTAEDVAYDQLDHARLFHFGYPPVMRAMYADDGEQLVRMFSRVRQRGLTTSLDTCAVDPAGEPGRVDWLGLLQRTLEHVDVFLPSIEELLFMVDRPRYEQLVATGGGFIDIARQIDGALLVELADRLIAMGAAIVVIKLGDQGLFVQTTDDAARLAWAGPVIMALDQSNWVGRQLLRGCFAVEVVGTTGSGDCTIAGFLAGLLHGQRIEDVLRSAVAVGACNCESPDAIGGIVPWSTVQQRIEADWPVRPVSLSLNRWTADRSSAMWRGPADRVNPSDPGAQSNNN
jgi:sugar/nucleoside kinase (ribokinase family)